MPEIPRGELRADAAQEVDELRALQPTLDLDLAEAEHLGPAVERLVLEDAPSQVARSSAPRVTLIWLSCRKRSLPTCT